MRIPAECHTSVHAAGGSRNTGNSILMKMHALSEAQGQLETHQQVLNAAQSALHAMSSASKQQQK